MEIFYQVFVLQDVNNVLDNRHVDTQLMVIYKIKTNNFIIQNIT